MRRDKSGMPADPANLQAFHSLEYKCSRKGAAASKSLRGFLAPEIDSNRMWILSPGVTSEGRALVGNIPRTSIQDIWLDISVYQNSKSISYHFFICFWEGPKHTKIAK